MENPEQQLAFLSNARRTLAQACTVEDVKKLRDQAEAVRVYVKSASLSLEIQNHAAELKLRAERKAGTLIAESISRGGDHRSKSHDATLKLSDLGIGKDQSSRWQLEASVPDADFEQFIADWHASRKELTSNALIRLAKARRKTRPKVRRGERKAPGFAEGLDRLLEQKTRFACIWASPPWPGSLVDGSPASGHGRSYANFVDLKKLPVRGLSAAKAHLHINSPVDALHEAIHLIEAWGFTYRSLLALRGAAAGYEKYWRCPQHFLLLGVRGELPFRDNGLSAWPDAEELLEAAGKDAIRRLIERVSPGPYLDLFGDGSSPGWNAPAAAR